MKRIVALGIVVLASGCAGPQLKPSPVSSSEEAQARRAMHSEPLPPRAGGEGKEQVAMVRRVERRIRPATRKACARTLDRDTCGQQYRKSRVKVKPSDDTINATADMHGNVTFYGGMIRRIGSDDEFAGVMAHEMAYVLLKHNQKSQQNMVVGGLLTWLSAAGGPCHTAQRADARADFWSEPGWRRGRPPVPSRTARTDGARGEPARDLHRGRGGLRSMRGAKGVHPLRGDEGFDLRVLRPGADDGGAGQPAARLAHPCPGALREVGGQLELGGGDALRPLVPVGEGGGEDGHERQARGRRSLKERPCAGRRRSRRRCPRSRGR